MSRVLAPSAVGVNLLGHERVLFLVVAAHVALLWLWTPSARAPGAANQGVTVRLLPASVDEPPIRWRRSAAPDIEKPPRMRASSGAGGRIQAGPPSPASLPATPATVDADTFLSASRPAEPASAPKPLDLSVRRADALDTRPPNAALADPRSNSPRLSPGERMAQALGTDTRLVEVIHPDGSVRIRQGTSCYGLRESRAAALDPFNSALRPSPRLASAC